MKFLTLFIILFILIFLTELIINKILGVQKEKISETPGKKIDRWGRGIIVVIFIISISPLSGYHPNIVVMLYWITLLGFQAIMEYIYINHTKQYIGTTILLVVGLIFIYSITIFIW